MSCTCATSSGGELLKAATCLAIWRQLVSKFPTTKTQIHNFSSWEKSAESWKKLETENGVYSIQLHV